MKSRHRLAPTADSLQYEIPIVFVIVFIQYSVDACILTPSNLLVKHMLHICQYM